MNASLSTRDWLERELDCLRELIEHKRKLIATAVTETGRLRYTDELATLEANTIRLARVLANLKITA